MLPHTKMRRHGMLHSHKTRRHGMLHPNYLVCKNLMKSLCENIVLLGVTKKVDDAEKIGQHNIQNLVDRDSKFFGYGRFFFLDR